MNMVRRKNETEKIIHKNSLFSLTFPHIYISRSVFLFVYFIRTDPCVPKINFVAPEMEYTQGFHINIVLFLQNPIPNAFRSLDPMGQRVSAS